MSSKQLEELVYKAQNNDIEAFYDIYKISHPGVYYFARAMLRHSHDAEDATQEVFIALYKHIGKIKTPAFLHSWLNTTTYRICINLKHKYKPLAGYDNDIARLLDITEDNPYYIPEEAVVIYQFNEAIMQFVDELPDDQRKCIISFYYQNISVKEIAVLMHTNENTVKTRLHNGRKKIFAMIKKDKKLVKLDHSDFNRRFNPPDYIFRNKRNRYCRHRFRYVKAPVISKAPYRSHWLKCKDIYSISSIPSYKVARYISLKMWRSISKDLDI